MMRANKFFLAIVLTFTVLYVTQATVSAAAEIKPKIEHPDW